ncbi:hypothetical protein ACFL2Z_01885 [Candidatus Eisenbacteria bacterium]|uniref:Fibronectin type-III domain-containing protein n=1 Tax=Eiseniibacteriota bacterium TaxID=2212470 RepID=A0ABV6YNL2_UNCEI
MARILLLSVLCFVFVLGCSKEEESPVDVTPPSSAVNALPAEVTSVPFSISWSGTDSGSGIKHYDVQSRDGDGQWAEWLMATSFTTSDFTGEDGHTYHFRCRAMDNAGNEEEYPDAADAHATVSLGPTVGWEKTIGGAEQDESRSVQQTDDGGYITAGSTRSYGAGGSDVYLVKLSASGEIEWDETYGASDNEGAWTVRQTSDGGYVIVAGTGSFGVQNGGVYLVKVTSVGGLEWERTFDGPGREETRSVIQTSDGGYIITGSTNSIGAGGQDVYLIKVDSSGDLEWEAAFGGTESEIGVAATQTADGGYMVAGATRSYGAGDFDIYLVKTDAAGALVWEKTYGTALKEEAIDMHQTSDNGFVVTGFTESGGGGGQDVYLLKTDSDGNLEWESTFGGSDDENGYSVRQTPDGGYIVAGWTYLSGPNPSDGFLMKTGPGGALQWQRMFGGSEQEGFFEVDTTDDGGYIVAGHTSSFGAGGEDIYIVKSAHN